MASKLNVRSEHEISQILNVSDSDIEPEFISIPHKLQKKKNSRLHSKTNVVDISSDTENVLCNVQNTLLQKNVLQKEKASLKIKLRRSTEQSLYKIDTDSESEQTICKSHKQILRPRKVSSSDGESGDLYTYSKDNFASKESGAQKLTGTQIENGMSKGNRIRRPPSRFSAYHCDILSSIKGSENASVDSPILRCRKTINYNEDKLFTNSIASNMKVKEESSKRKMHKGTEKSNLKNNLEVKQLNTNSKDNKRNRVPFVEDSEYDSGSDINLIKIKALRKSNKSTNIICSNWSHSPEMNVVVNKQDLLTSAHSENTPVKVGRQKRLISVQQTDNIESDIDEECLADKRTKTSLVVKNVTPTRRNILTQQKRNNTQEGVKLHFAETHLSTPKSRAIKCCNITPSLRKRNSALIKPRTPLQEARSRLHVSAVPKSLPCREEEFNNIFTFLRRKLEDRSGGCIYISGVPGTGKTATVNEAVRCLQKLIIKGHLNDFNYVSINGMKLTEPRQAYVQILKQLDGKTATWEQSYCVLEKRFHSKNSKMTLLLVDELDFLCTKRQDVVYNLLDWPTKSTAQLVVITIANTMDLPERILMGRVTSRLGLTRLTFQPYNYKQLQEIVMSRLKDFSGFRNEAVQLVARKVSAVSGDARRALDICRRAMEIGESRNVEMISLQDVTQAVTEMIASAKVQAIKHCSKLEKIFLQAVSAEVTRTSIEEVYFKDAYKQLESLCSFDGIEVPTVTEILTVCGRLGANRLLICEHSKNDIYQKILLNVSIDDIHYAVQELDLNS